jgi:heat shock protein HtpX
VSSQNLFAQQQANRRRSALLVAGFLLFFAWIGFGGDLSYYLLSRDAPPGAYRHDIPFLGIATVAFAAVIAWSSWKRGARRVLWATGAWKLVEAATPEQRRLANVVEEMSIASGVPKPTVWIVPDSDPNAFATGVDPREAHIAVTEGMLATLNRDELQGVVAHEMAHIQNLDIRLMTLLAAMVGAVALLSDGLRNFMRFGGVGGRRGGGSRKGGNGPAGFIVLIVWLVTLLLAPLLSRIMAMAVSRNREYLADATAAQFTRNPAALASALEQLDSAAGATRSITRGAAHLCIVDPGERRLAARDGAVADLFASHPPIRHRVVRLRGMAFQQAKQEGVAVLSDLPPA